MKFMYFLEDYQECMIDLLQKIKDSPRDWVNYEDLVAELVVKYPKELIDYCLESTNIVDMTGGYKLISKRDRFPKLDSHDGFENEENLR